MADLWMDSVESRVDALEKRVFGDADKDAHFPRCVDSMAVVQNKMMSGIHGKAKFIAVLQRLNEIEQYMDPNYTEQLTLTDQAKSDILVAQEDWVKKMITDLDKMEQLQAIMDSEHLKVIPSLHAKFQELSKKHVKQQDGVAQFTEEANDLLIQYTNLVTTLSKQLVLWDETLTITEKDVLPKGKPY